MKKFIIDQQNLGIILDYLATRPFKEVYQAIHYLEHLQEYKEPIVDTNQKEPQ